MAGYSEKDVDSTEDDRQWKPPTEAEMKVLQARRERSDRISKIMGSYLLKGYKMLASECSRCGTIELQDRTGRNYCVACEEIDPDIQKDNPALSEKAASSQRAEHQYSERNQHTVERVDSSYGLSTLQSVSANLQQSLASVPQLKPQPKNPEEEFSRCFEAVHKKLAWARVSLEAEVDPNTVTSYLKVITSCVEAIYTLKKFAG